MNKTNLPVCDNCGHYEADIQIKNARPINYCANCAQTLGIINIYGFAARKYKDQIHNLHLPDITPTKDNIKNHCWTLCHWPTPMGWSKKTTNNGVLIEWENGRQIWYDFNVIEETLMHHKECFFDCERNDNE